jgi:hypothetical protein
MSLNLICDGSMVTFFKNDLALDLVVCNNAKWFDLCCSMADIICLLVFLLYVIQFYIVKEVLVDLWSCSEVK